MTAQPESGPRWSYRYVVAVGSTGAALALRLAIDPLVGPRGGYILFLLAIAVTAWYGGVRPALLATVLGSFTAHWFFVPPRYSLFFETAGDLLLTASFVVTALIVSLIVHNISRDRVRLRREAEERRRAEAEVLRLNGELERRVQERTRELEEVVYTVAHDLRAPLRAMKGFADLLLEDAGERLCPEERDHLGRIGVAARQMDTLIRDLLAYSALNRGELTPRILSLGSILDAVLREMKTELEGRQAEIIVEPGIPDVEGHDKGVRLVLFNLISNAVKFVAPGTLPRVRIFAQTRDTWVRLTIEDNGIGISPEYHERIFRVFERLNNSETYPGTGIGLAITKRAIVRMGGRLGVESDVGKGTRFWIELPQAASPVIAPPTPK